MNGSSSQAPLSLSFIGFNGTHAMHSNKWETSTQMTLETGEGITTSERNAHGNPNTWDPSIVFKHLGTQEMPIGAHGTQRLH